MRMTGYGASSSDHDFFAFDGDGNVWDGSAFVAWVDVDFASYRIAPTVTATIGGEDRFEASAPDGTVRYELRFRGATAALSYLAWESSVWASQASVDAVAAGVAGLVGTELNHTSPVGTDGDVSVYRARDYANADGLALEWSNSAGTWPDLTGATIVVRLGMPGCSTVALYEFDATAPVPSGANQTVRLELTDADLSIRPDDYTYNVVATLISGRIVNLYVGSWSVLFALEAPA